MTRPGPGPAFGTDTVVLAGRVLRTTRRDPVALVGSLFFPLVLMVIMSAGFAEIVMPGRGIGGYLDHALPLFAVMGVAFASLGTAAATYLDARSGIDARLRTLPVATLAPYAGRVVADAARALTTVTVVVLVGLAMGFRFRTDVLGLLGFVAVPILFGVALSWVMIAFALRASSAEAVGGLLNALLLVLSFLSTGFVPLEALPGWAQPIAMVNPLSLTVEAMRELAQGGPAAVAVAGALAWSLALTAVGAALVRASRRHGD